MENSKAKKHVIIIGVEKETNKIIEVSSLIEFPKKYKSISDYITDLNSNEGQSLVYHYDESIVDMNFNQETKYLYVNGELILDDETNNEIKQKQLKEEAQVYLDKTDRFVARLYEAGTPIPEEVKSLRAYYRTVLDNSGQFPELVTEAIDKLTQLNI